MTRSELGKEEVFGKDRFKSHSIGRLDSVPIGHAG